MAMIEPDGWAWLPLFCGFLMIILANYVSRSFSHTSATNASSLSSMIIPL